VFHAILLTAWTVFHLYLFRHVSSLPAVKRRFRWFALLIMTAICWTTYFLPGWADGLGWRGTARPLEYGTMTWLGTIFLLFTCLFIIDLITLFGLLFRKYLAFLRTAAITLGILLSIHALYLGFRAPVIREYEVHLAHLPPQYDGQTLAVVSDLHVGDFLDEAWLAARIKQVNNLRAAAVLLLGDVFEGDSPEERKRSMMSLLRGLSAPLGVWGVTGNHDGHGGLESTVRFLEASGVRMLRNRWVELEPGVVLAGVDDPRGRGPVADPADRIRQALSGRPDSCATIVLSHRPRGAEVAASAGAGLMLSGHTHGGQLWFWPFSYFWGLANPLFAGESAVDGMPVIVSRGAGTWGPRMRLWYPGEIVRIVLRSGAKVPQTHP